MLAHLAEECKTGAGPSRESPRSSRNALLISDHLNELHAPRGWMCTPTPLSCVIISPTQRVLLGHLPDLQYQDHADHLQAAPPSFSSSAGRC